MSVSLNTNAPVHARAGGSVPHVPVAADGKLPVQAAEALVRQVRQAPRGDLLRGLLPRHQGV